MTPRSVRVEIDELVLHGFDPRDRHRIGDALLAELAGLVADATPAPTAGAAVDRIEAGRFTVGTGADGASVGREAARALHRSITSCR
jgi:hypothetical protein